MIEQTSWEFEILRAVEVSNKVPAPPSMLYHYCPMETFHKILNTKQLFLTHFEHLNDYLDSKWIYQFIDTELERFVDKTEVDDFINFFNLNTKDIYVACFSEDGDILSQWRAYGDDGKGISIGFSTSLLNIGAQFPHIGAISNSNIGIIKMNYEKEVQKKLVRSFLNFGSDAPDNTKLPYIAAQGYLSRLALIFKNPKFFEEREWRIAKLAIAGSVAPHHRVANNKNVPYHLLNLRQFSNLGIGGLVLGPKNAISPSELVDLLKTNGVYLEPDRILSSEASYQ